MVLWVATCPIKDSLVSRSCVFSKNIIGYYQHTQPSGCERPFLSIRVLLGVPWLVFMKKVRVSVTMTQTYVEALDLLVDSGLYLARGEAVLDALRVLFKENNIESFIVSD